MLFLALAVHVSHADSGNGHQQIFHAVQDFLASLHTDDPGTRTEIEVSNLDPRLQINTCKNPLSTRLNQQQQATGRMTVRVECHDEHNTWTRYVQANVRVFTPVVVSTRVLQRGDIVSAIDMEMQELDLSAIRQTALRDMNHANGMQVRRTVPAGTPLTAEMLTPAMLIERGDTVMITAERGSIRIRQQGIAMQNGAKGSRINIRNSSSDRVVQAVVTGPGQASVNF